MDGINVIRVWSYIAPNSGFIKRSIDQISSAFTSSIAGLFTEKPDYIIASSPQFFSAWAAFLLSAIRRVPWVFEVRDMWPEGIIFLEKDSILYRVLEKIEIALYRSAEKVVVVTNSFKESIIERSGISEAKIEVIYNGSNNRRFFPRKKNQELLNKLGVKNKFIVGYAGTLGISHSLEFIFKEISQVSNENIHFLFIGDGALKTELENIIHRYQISNISMIDPVDKNEIAEYLSIFDIGLVPLKKSEAYLKVIPSKSFELSSMEIPIMLGVDGEMRDILNMYNAGVYFEPEDSYGFHSALRSLYMNKNELKDLYSEGLGKMSKDFNRDMLASKMMKFLSDRG
jgi:glycosyltransferase involved in cell wall biosynthesis